MKILDFFNIWVFVRTSTNFAHLASFQAIAFVDWPVPKTLDIFVYQTSENKAFCNCCSRRMSTRFNLIPSFHAFRWDHLALWPPFGDQEARASFLHLHVSAELFTTQNVGKKWTFEFGESTGKLGLKMTNRTHTDERKMVQLYYLVPGCVISMFIFIFIFINQSYVSMVRWVSTREVPLYFGFWGTVVRPHMIF